MSEQVFKQPPASKVQVSVPASLYRNKELLKVAMAAHKGVRGARQADPAHAPPPQVETPKLEGVMRLEGVRTEAPKETPKAPPPTPQSGPHAPQSVPPRPARKTIVAYDGRWY